MTRPRRETPRHLGRLDRSALLNRLGFLLVGVFLLLTGLHAGDSPAWTAFDNFSESLAAVLATIACAIRVVRERRLCASVRQIGERDRADESGAHLQRQTLLAWSLLTAAVGAWAVGQIGWSIYEVSIGTEPPTPSPFDGVFLFSSVLVVCGLLAMVRTPAGYLSQLRGALEGLFISGGFLLCSWGLLIDPVIANSHTTTLADLINLAYPVLDALALAAAFFVLVRRRRDSPAGLALIALGIACMAASDSAYWYLTAIHPRFPGVSPLDGGWVAGLALIGIAALRSGAPGRSRWRALDARPALALPALPALLGIPIVLHSWLGAPELRSTTIVVIFAVVALIGVALLVVVTYENYALTSDLERRVEARTAELRRTERYYRALVQNSSDAIMVLEPDLTIRYVTDSIETIFGYRAEDLAGRSLEVFGRAAADTLAEALGQLGFLPDHVARAEWPLTDAAGRLRHAETTITDLLTDPQVGGYVLNTRDETDRVALTDQLRYAALHDPLTGLPNRALLSDRAAQALSRSQRHGSCVAVMAIDLDHFGLLSTDFGHQTGDLILRAVAQRLQAAVRPQDTVAKLGGDEFAVLVDAVADREEALAAAERVREALLAAHILEADRHTITASVGVAVGSAPEQSFEQLLCDAVVALHAVKRAGRDAVQLFQPSMQPEANTRFKLQGDLREAIENEEFWLFYQPQLDANTERLWGFEALVRWNSREHGLLAPERFVGLAEETGLIVPLGRWVLRQALLQAAAWGQDDPAGRPVTVSVKVSALQLSAPSLPATVESALEESGIDPDRVVLGVAESSLVDCSPRLVEVLRTLKELGVRLALDDFGTGYASIPYLQSLPIDILKLDSGLIPSGSEGGRRDERFKATVNVGRTLSLVTIADGIEEPGQLAAARNAGCDLAQGYLLGRPLPPEQAQRMIAEAGAGARPLA